MPNYTNTSIDWNQWTSVTGNTTGGTFTFSIPEPAPKTQDIIDFAIKNAGMVAKHKTLPVIGRIVGYAQDTWSWNGSYLIAIENIHDAPVFKLPLKNNKIWPIEKNGIYWLCCDAHAGTIHHLRDIVLL